MKVTHTLVRSFEILVKVPLRFALGWLFSSRDPLVSYAYERIPGPGDHASGGIIKLQDLSSVFSNRRWRANTLYLISSCFPWTVRWQVRVAKAFGAKVVLNQNGVAYPAWNPEGWKNENERASWVHKRADVVIYQSDFCRRCALEWLEVEEPANSIVLLNPVDLKTFSSEGKDVASVTQTDELPAREEIDSRHASSVMATNAIRTAPFCILLAGSHQFAYRVKGAIETIKHLGDDYHLVVAGAYRWRDSEDEALAEARKWVEKFEVVERVSFRGRYTQEEAPALFSESDILLHTKVMDPCPRLVAEALGSGLPVVYAASGGLPEMVSPDAGVGVDSAEDFERERPVDPMQFAEAIRKVRAGYPAYCDAARRCAEERFNRDEWLKAHGELFSAVRAHS